MKKVHWILLAPLSSLFTSHNVYSGPQTFPILEMDMEACTKICTDKKLAYNDMFQTLDPSGSGQTIYNCECIELLP